MYDRMATRLILVAVLSVLNSPGTFGINNRFLELTTTTSQHTLPVLLVLWLAYKPVERQNFTSVDLFATATRVI